MSFDRSLEVDDEDSWAEYFLIVVLLVAVSLGAWFERIKGRFSSAGKH